MRVWSLVVIMVTACSAPRAPAQTSAVAPRVTTPVQFDDEAVPQTSHHWLAALRFNWYLWLARHGFVLRYEPHWTDVHHGQTPWGDPWSVR